LIELDE
jgi:hypothetical protein